MRRLELCNIQFLKGEALMIVLGSVLQQVLNELASAATSCICSHVATPTGRSDCCQFMCLASLPLYSRLLKFWVRATSKSTVAAAGFVVFSPSICSIFYFLLTSRGFSSYFSVFFSSPVTTVVVVAVTEYTWVRAMSASIPNNFLGLGRSILPRLDFVLQCNSNSRLQLWFLACASFVLPPKLQANSGLDWNTLKTVLKFLYFCLLNVFQLICFLDQLLMFVKFLLSLSLLKLLWLLLATALLYSSENVAQCWKHLTGLKVCVTPFW